MTIPTLAPTPVRGDPDTFSTAFETFLSGLDPWAVAVQAVGDAADADAAAAAASVVDAADEVVLAAAQVVLAAAQVALATTQANNAAISAAAAAGSALVAGAVAWVSGTTYAIGDTRYSPNDFQTYRRTTSGAGTTDPSADSTNWTKALAVGITSVTTATTATTLTSTATLLKITPASYGVAVTLPDATTCSVGGPLHIIDNKGAYPVRVLNSAGTLLGFIFAGVVSHISLIDNSTAVGVWTVENSELVGASAQLLTTAILSITACVAIDANREYLQGTNASGHVTGVVYDKSTNTFGAVTTIRAASVSNRSAAVLSAANQILACSCTNGGAAFEAVVLSISGTTITVNTAATATLSANISAFADGCGLIAVGSSFVTSYTVATPAAQIRALSISGTTVTIGSAEVLDGTAGGLIALGDSTHVIAVSTATTHLYTKPYTVSGSTLNAGTGTDTNSGTMTLVKLTPLGVRWFIGYTDGGTVSAGVVSLSGTTTTISTVAASGSSGYPFTDAIVVGSDKVLILTGANTQNVNIITDTGGTASAGTAILCDSSSQNYGCFVSGTSVTIIGAGNVLRVIDCSGASPVVSKVSSNSVSTSVAAAVGAKNAMLARPAGTIFGSDFLHVIQTTTYHIRIVSGELQVRSRIPLPGSANRGKADSERWLVDGETVITKLECVA